MPGKSSDRRGASGGGLGRSGGACGPPGGGGGEGIAPVIRASASTAREHPGLGQRRASAGISCWHQRQRFKRNHLPAGFNPDYS